MNVRVVELVGAPGSGKSTLASWLAGRSVAGRFLLPAQQLRLEPRRALATLSIPLDRPAVRAQLARRDRLRAALLRPDADAAPLPDDWEAVLVRIAAQVPSGRRGADPYRASALAWLRTTAALADAAGRSDPTLVPVIEEGIAQRALSVLGTPDRADLLDELLARQAPGTLLVHLVAPDGLLVDRALRRLGDGLAPLLHRGLDGGLVADLVREDAAALSRIVERCAARGSAVLALGGDADSGVEQHGEAVLDAVRRGLSDG